VYKIAVIPGDGTGPEVTTEAVKVLAAAAQRSGFKYETTNFDFGGDRYLRTGEVLPESAVGELSHRGHSRTPTLGELANRRLLHRADVDPSGAAVDLAGDLGLVGHDSDQPENALRAGA